MNQSVCPLLDAFMEKRRLDRCAAHGQELADRTVAAFASRLSAPGAMAALDRAFAASARQAAAKSLGLVPRAPVEPGRIDSSFFNNPLPRVRIK